MHLDNGSNVELFVVGIALIAVSISLIIARGPVSRFASRHDRDGAGFRNGLALLNSQLGVVLVSVAWILIGIVAVTISIFVRVYS